MRTIGLVLLLSANLLAQTASPLDLTRPLDLTSKSKLVDTLMAVSTPEHLVNRADAETFANELNAALTGRSLSKAQVDGIRKAVLNNLRTSGSNFSIAQRLQELLGEADVPSEQIHLIIGPFIRIGEALRGPDDSPMVDSR